jgi:hypothetical protein
VAPTKDGYEFEPTQRNYSDVQAGQGNQDYTSAAITPVISGSVTDNGTGVPGVTLIFSNGAGSTTTGSNGGYSHTVAYGWSGIVTPSKEGYQFNPTQKTYTGVQIGQGNQNYEAILLEFEISGKVSKVTNTGGSPLAGVTLTFQPDGGTMATVITGATGEYSHRVTYGWSGVVTPSRTNYGFSPDAMRYNNINSDNLNQDYSAFPEVTQTYRITGGVRRADGSGLRGVILAFSNGGGYAVSDGDGQYSRTVSEGWGGIVTLLLSGYSFDPGRQSYTGVYNDLFNQDYTANAVPLVISGRVSDAKGTGIPGVTLTYLDSSGQGPTTVTDFNGIYQVEVNHGWWGTVTPGKEGYEFSPVGRDYEYLSSGRLNQDYEGAVIAAFPVISGRVSDAQGVGIGNVTITFSGDGGTGTSSASTDANGNYSHLVEAGWSGSAAPWKEGYEFAPGSRPYNNVTSDLAGEDYSADAVFPVISGMVKRLTGAGFPRVPLDFAGTIQTYSNDIGMYAQTVPFGWTGFVTPVKSGYEFEPPFLEYENVNTNQLNRDYVTTTLFLYITGRVTTPGGEGVADILLTFSNGGGITVTDENGDYVHGVDFAWSGTVTPSSEEYTFEFPFIEYPRLEENRYDQNFTAHEILPVISGRVTQSTPSGIFGLGGVSLNFSDGAASTETDQEGYYAQSVPSAWFGSITPEKNGYVFFPTSQYYSNVVLDTPDQNFTSIDTDFSLRFEGQRIVAGPVIIRKHFAELNLTVERTAGNPVSIYVILRRESRGIYQENITIPGSQLQVGETYTYYDDSLDRDKTYTYKVIVKNASGRVIGASNEVTI